MVKKVFENTFLVFVLISVFSYGFLAYNIQNQGIDIDEVFHHGFSMTYFDLIMEGELSDPCITGQGECSKIDLTCAGEIQWVASGGILKGVLVGLGDYFFSDSERIYYASSDAEPCRPIHFNQGVIGENTPTQTELEAARFFSPIFGALSVGISFCVGKLLFNRFVGISFAAVLLFHGLWIHHSRIITSEVYVNFFII